MTLTADLIATARSLLFVPASRADRFEKATASGADAVVVDLEDAVAAEDKDAAREAVRAWLATGGRAVVRINAAGTPWYEDDLKALRGEQAIVMLPKVTRSEEIRDVLARLAGGSCVLPVIETADAVLDARALCRTPGVVRCVFGNGDLAAQLGVPHDDLQALAYARSSLVLVSAAAGVAAPLDGVTTALHDDDLLRQDCVHAAQLGFTGKMCIHPRQVHVVHDVFTPTAAELAQAQRVVAAAGDGSVTTLDGQMIDAPIVARARGLLEHKDRIPARDTRHARTAPKDKEAP